MPNAKRSKSSGGRAAATREPPKDTTDGRPTPAEVEEQEHRFVQVARQHWLKPGKKTAKVKVKNDVIKQGIWDVLEQDGFSYKLLLLLESLQTLERYECLRILCDLVRETSSNAVE